MYLHHKWVDLGEAQMCRTSQNSPLGHRLCSDNQMGQTEKSSAYSYSHKKFYRTSTYYYDNHLNNNKKKYL